MKIKKNLVIESAIQQHENKEPPRFSAV